MVEKSTATKSRKKAKRLVVTGSVYVYASFNNTIISVTDAQGNLISWATAGGSGFKGSRKSTPYAATKAAQTACQKAREFGLKSVSVRVRGPGPGRESAVRAVGEFFHLSTITDDSRIPFNGCKQEKERRV